MLKILFWAFLVCLKLLILKILVWILVDNDAHLKGFDDIRRILGGHLKKRGIGCFRSRRGALMAVWWSGETWARHKFGQFSLVYFEKKATFETFVCVGAETLYFPVCWQKWQNYICTHFGLWAQVCTKLCFLLGVGWVVLFFLVGGFLIGLFWVLLVFCLFVFCFETNIPCLPFLSPWPGFLPGPPFSLSSLSLSLSIFLSLFLIFFSLFFFFSLSLSLSRSATLSLSIYIYIFIFYISLSLSLSLLFFLP